MLLKAASNGNRTPQEHKNIPMTPKQLVTEVEIALLQGITVFHIHPRGKDGNESLKASDIKPTISAIRTRHPFVQIGISTGEWIEPDLNMRLKHVSGWEGIVDFASVNFSEAGANKIAYQLLELGVGVEAGLFHPKAAESFVNSGIAEHCLRIMFEPEDATVADAVKTVKSIEVILEAHQIKNKSRLLHGYNLTTWPLMQEAKKRGYDTRIGFEDTLLLPDNQPAQNNGQLIDAAKKLLFDT